MKKTICGLFLLCSSAVCNGALLGQNYLSTSLDIVNFSKAEKTMPGFGLSLDRNIAVNKYIDVAPNFGFIWAFSNNDGVETTAMAFNFDADLTLSAGTSGHVNPFLSMGVLYTSATIKINDLRQSMESISDETGIRISAGLELSGNDNFYRFKASRLDMVGIEQFEYGALAGYHPAKDLLLYFELVKNDYSGNLLSSVSMVFLFL